MDKHTPGPWVRNPTSLAGKNWTPVQLDAAWIVLGREGDSEPVAIVIDVEDRNPGRLEANALLIAAAPKMLALLQRAFQNAKLPPKLEADISALLQAVMTSADRGSA